ncbi:MAG: hypothetical protein K0S33_2719 [Bacteroidetes bacterium]|jgi:hypothetical protein|nr:hypothetical protein [Bacteroidota bacterium]
MAKCNFDIAVKEPVEQLIAKARSGISSANGSFEGNNEKGNYSIPTALGSISGTYTAQDSTIRFEITDKPGIIPCSKIEKELRKYLGVE